ncbi:MAG: hypothetical protein H7301_02610 [Cryobacterium sp.]|nr:hypothetical protein [Oligoflexia bacterium]
MTQKRLFSRTQVSLVASALALSLTLFACAPSAKSTSAMSSSVTQTPDISNQSATSRPPQFVLFAFDGSYNNDFWEESLSFAKENDVRFTYFVSGVYFLLNTNKNIYREPTQGVGKSAIGFGGNSSEGLLARVNHVNVAFQDGNEIGSHANGHFDGTRYTVSEWKSEFAQFWQLLFGVYNNNRGLNGTSLNGLADDSSPFLFSRKDITGFRAPLLGRSSATDTALVDAGFQYDTSRTAEPTHWPYKSGGLWEFPLARLTIAGTAKRTLSMDYNFFMVQSHAHEDAAHTEKYEREMLQTYQNYFLKNYNGNRAPVHIGHHFVPFNGGAYWRAMKRFAQTVCHLPEVKCGTYSELQEFMDSHSKSELAHYQAGDFPHSSALDLPKVSSHIQELELSGNLEKVGTSTFTFTLDGKDFVNLKPAQVVVSWSLNGVVVKEGPISKVSRIEIETKANDTLRLSVHSGKHEILTVTKTLGDGTNAMPEASHESKALQGDQPEAHGFLAH